MSTIYVPRRYQEHTTGFILDVPDCGIWQPMGLGKTVSTATAVMHCLYDSFDVRRVLIVGPKRVAAKVWPDEFAKWKHLAFMKYRVLGAGDFGLTPTLATLDYYDPKLERIRQKEKKGKLAFGYDGQANRKAKAATKKHLQSLTERIHIVSWDFLEYLVDAYGVNWPYEMVVLDESSFVKNQDTNRFRAVRSIRKYTGRIVQLTGTPATNGLLNIWAQLFLLDAGKRLGETYTAYRSAYFSPAARSPDGNVVYSWAIDQGAKDRIYSRIGDIVMSLKASDWIDLPDVIDNPVMIDLPDHARELYDKVERDLVAMVNSRDVTARNPAALVNKLMQIANGTVYDDGKKPQHVHDEKLKALAELAEADGNLLVFYAYRPEAEAIQKFFGRKAVKLDTPQRENEWNAGKIRIAYAHAASIGYGSNIQKGGNRTVWFGPCYNLEHWQQANARLVRSGQEADHVIQSCIMATNTLDKHVRYKVLADKEDEQQDLMDAVLARIEERK